MCSVAEAPLLSFEGEPVPIAVGQTVLAALEAVGVAVESSCRAGVCQSCLMQAVEGAPPRRAQEGLTAGQIAQGLFMACVCRPETPLAVARDGFAHNRCEAVVQSIDKLSDSVLRLVLQPVAAFPFRAGQFIRLITADGLIRSYSIASRPDQSPMIELHVRLIPHGRMSGRLSNATAPGDTLTVSGPSGGCTYEGVDPDQPLLLAGAGTGLAPLWGVLNDALASGHRGPISLYHGALDRRGLYLVNELEALQGAHANFRYRPCVRDGGDPAAGDLIAAVKAEAAVPGTAIFLCGDADLVKRLKRALFLAGARLDQIRADPFEAAA